MTDKELEQALRRVLKAGDPGEPFTARVMARLDAERVPRVPAVIDKRASRRSLQRWSAPAALAACALAAVGLVHWRYEAMVRERGVEARAQLLQALKIVGAQVSGARAAVLRDEGRLD